MAALAIGGTGISPLLHLIAAPPSHEFFSYGSAVDALIKNSRLLGLFDSSSATGAWQSVFGETPRSVRLPIETFGYQYTIGGYHAVLAGFLLQFLATLTDMTAIPRSSQAVRSRLEFVLGLTVPLTLCCNTWMLPLQASLVAAWTVWDRRGSDRWNVLHLAAGAAIGVLLLLPLRALVLGGLVGEAVSRKRGCTLVQL